MVMFFFRAKKYLHYKLFARHKRGHGIHSPFLYELIGTVFRNKNGSSVVLLVERIRRKNRRDRREIRVNDLGSGSLRIGRDIRRISRIARNSPIPKKYGILLSNLVSVFGGSAILELGTSLGISTAYLALGAPGAKVYTIEGCAETAAIAKENFLAVGIENIRQYTGSFNEIMPVICESGIEFGVIFIDGDHRKEPLLGYFNYLASVSGCDTVIVIDDIYNSPDMAEAWEQIKADDRVSLSLDIYRMGILFFKKGMTKCNCLLRY